MSLLVLLAAKGFTRYPRFIRRANLKKGIYTFFIILTVIYSGVMSFSLKSFRPNNQHCLAFQYIGNLPDVDIVVTLEGPEFEAPGLSYLQKNVAYYTSFIANVDYFCTQYKSSTLFIVIHEKDYLKRESYLTTIFNARGVSWNMTFSGTHERFDSTILVFKKPIS